MARTCTVCHHSERAAIDAALVANTPYRTIADRFSVSKTALIRHRAEHIPAAVAQAQGARQEAQADNLLAQVRGLQAKAVGILFRAEEKGDLRTALAAIREARGNLELLAKLLGELDERPQVNFILAPQWIVLRTAVLRALTPYPDAMAAVTRALTLASAQQAGAEKGHRRYGT